MRTKTTGPWRAVIALTAMALAACAHKSSAELQAQTGDEPVEPTATPAAEQTRRNTNSTRIGAAPAESDPGESAPPPADLSGQGGQEIPAACPLRCVVAGHGTRDVAAEETAKLNSAFGSTMSALRMCAARDSSQSRRHGPTLNLRFGANNALTDVGVDGTGFDSEADDCFQQVVRGGSRSFPAVSYEGPVTVRCAERCDKKPAWVSPR